MSDSAAIVAIGASQRSRKATAAANSAAETAYKALEVAQDALKQAMKAVSRAEATAKQKGPQGDDGEDGRDGKDGTDGVGLNDIELAGDRLVFRLSDDSLREVHLPLPEPGQPGDRGDDGRGIAHVEIRGRSLWVIYTDGEEEDCGEVIPPQTEIRRKKKSDDYPMVMRLRDGGAPAKQSVLYEPMTITSDTAVNASYNYIIDADASAGNITITLPAPVDSDRITYHIKKVDASVNTVTVQPSSGLIDGNANVTISEQYTNALLISNGSEYLIR